jgi:hypothetical protein
MWIINQNYYTNEVNNNNFETNDFNEVIDFMKEELSHITSLTKEEIYDEIEYARKLQFGEKGTCFNEKGDEIFSIIKQN